jgi:hypothetical protein
MKNYRELLESGKVKKFKSNGKSYEIMIDSSRHGDVYRLWKVQGLKSTDLPDGSTGYYNIDTVHAQAENLIIKKFF